MLPKPNTFSTAEDFRTGSILLIDKPLDWTSFDVVNKVRYIIRKQLGFRKIKVGHAGTLDPKATGLLVICTGKMTKEIQHFTADAKTYTGTFHLGATRPSFDLETEIDAHFPIDHITDDLLREAAQNMTGKIQQTPPVFSAKKVDGQRAYKAARAGKEIELKPVEVEIFEFELTRIALPEVDFKIKCSKGTYIRSMAFDFGKALNSGAHLQALRRTESGQFKMEDGMSIEHFQSRIASIEPLPQEGLAK